MAKQFIDASISTEKESMAKRDGTALTLDGQVRVLYDDTLTTKQLYVLISRIRDRIQQLEE